MLRLDLALPRTGADMVRRARRLKRLRRIWAVLGHYLADIKFRGEASLAGRREVQRQNNSVHVNMHTLVH